MLKKFFAKLDWWLKLSFGAIFIMDVGVFLPWYNKYMFVYSSGTRNYSIIQTGFDIELGCPIIIASVTAIVGCLAEKFSKRLLLVKIIAQIIQIIGGLWQLFILYIFGTFNRFTLDFDDYYGVHELLAGFWLIILGYSIWFGAVLLRFLMNFRLANFDRLPTEPTETDGGGYVAGVLKSEISYEKRI